MPSLFSTTMFTWHKNDYRFSQEASSLGFSAVDPIPDKITLKSAKTGEVRIFKKTRVEAANPEGEIAAWHFQCYEDPRLTLTIWND